MNFLMILVLVPTLTIARHVYYPQPRPVIFHCHTLGVHCVEKNIFTLCTRYSRIILTERNTLICPAGYLCQENSRQPCVEDPESIRTSSNDCSSSSSTTAMGTTTRNASGNTEINSIVSPQSSTIIESQDTTVLLEEVTTENKAQYENTKPVCTTEPPKVTDSKAETTTENETQSTNTEPFWTTSELIEVTESNEKEGEITTKNETQQTELFWTTRVASEETESDEIGTTILNEADDPIPSTTRDLGKSTHLPPPMFCIQSGTFPGPTCSQYYECVPHWIFWYRPTLKTCNEGDNFSIAWSRCVPSSESECID